MRPIQVMKIAARIGRIVMVRIIIAILAAVFGAIIMADILFIVGRKEDPYHDDIDVLEELKRWDEVIAKERSKKQ